MDKLTKEQRHRCMAAIRGKNTKPELLVRKFLFSRGYRYRQNHPLSTAVSGMDIKTANTL